jgi:hypothetical protein
LRERKKKTEFNTESTEDTETEQRGTKIRKRKSARFGKRPLRKSGKSAAA